MHCQNCHEVVPESAKVCGHCGTKLDRKALFPCPSCEEKVPVVAKVCGYCGTRLAEITPESQPAQLAEKAKKAQTPKKSARVKTTPKPVKETDQNRKPKKTAKAAAQKKSGLKIPKWAWFAGGGAILVIILLIFLPGNKPVSMVYFGCDQQTVPLGNEIFVYYYWLAKEPRQVDAFFEAAEHFVSVNDVWYKIRRYGLDEMRYDAEEGGYKQRYWMNIGSLDQPGWYRIRTVVDINEQVFDGWGWNGPGTANPRIDLTCDVQVVE